VVGLVVAFGLQLDTIDLVNRLFINDDARAKLMDIASKVQQAASTNPGANPGKEAQAPAGAQGNGQSSSGTDINAYYSQLSNAGLITFPSGQSFTLGNILRRLPGVLLTALLLSLGAPFWYNTLSSLLKLRSPSALKDDQQRSERQSSQTGDTGSSSAPPGQLPVTARVRLPIMPSEQGDLNAVG